MFNFNDYLKNLKDPQGLGFPIFDFKQRLNDFSQRLKNPSDKYRQRMMTRLGVQNSQMDGYAKTIEKLMVPIQISTITPESLKPEKPFNLPSLPSVRNTYPAVAGAKQFTNNLQQKIAQMTPNMDNDLINQAKNLLNE